MKNSLTNLKKELSALAKKQDAYEASTINLIAADSATPFKYLHNLPYKRYAITEGLLHKRPYAGVAYFDKIEQIAVMAACKVFNAEHANVQPHSGSQANQAVYQGLLENGDSILAMSFASGGHLTHGLKINFSGRFFNFSFYDVDKKTGLIDYDEIEKIALKQKPKLIVCGASSYPRTIDFKRLRVICNKVGAYLMADLSHPAGLIAAGLFPNPFPYTDVVTLTLDKTMRGPHGGLVLCKKELQQKIDKGVHPGTQSSIPLQRIFQIALCLLDVGTKEYKSYAIRIIKNMKVLEKHFQLTPHLLVTGGTDTHMIILDTYNIYGVTGKQAEELLETIGLLSNRQVIPGEQLKPYIASGLRLGTAWVTSRGYIEAECKQLAIIITNILKDPKNEQLKNNAKKEINILVKKRRHGDVWLE